MSLSLVLVNHEEAKHWLWLKSICDEWDFWTWQQLEKTYFESGYYFYFAANKEKACALLVVHKGPFELDIIYVYVIKEWRGKGSGTMLLRAFLAQERNFEKAFLEVAKDNEAALKLYTSLGFMKIGERKDYYGRGQDAWTMALIMKV